MPHLLSRLTILAWLGCACTAAAQPDIQIVGPERLPYIVDRNGSGSGPAVELVRLIARAAGIDQEVRILPFQRAVRQLDEGDTLYPALLRTPPREDLYVWIGEVFADRAVLFTRRDGPPVSEIAAARRLERISVMRGSELHGILRSFGLQNVETNISEDHNARLLRAERIEAWFTRLAEHTVREWSDLPLRKINNHSYWAAWSVMAVAVIDDRRDLFDWSVGQFRIAANQVDDQGYLANEMRRSQRALAYHNYALPPLAMIAAFAEANQVDLRGENHGALQRLAERVLQGARDPAAFAQRTGSKQDMSELRKDFKYAWLAPYCSLYACSEETRELNQEMGPFNSFRLGGEVTQVFNGRRADSGAPANSPP